MSKNLKKILVTGASLLMFASVGAGISNVSNVHANTDEQNMDQDIAETEASNKNFNRNAENGSIQTTLELRNDKNYPIDVVGMLNTYPDLAHSAVMNKMISYLSPKGREQFDEYYFNNSSTDVGGNLKESSDAAAGLNYDPKNSADNYLPLKGQHYISTAKEKRLQDPPIFSNDGSKAKTKKHAKQVSHHARKAKKHNKRVAKVNKKYHKARKHTRKNRKHAKKSTKRTKLSKKQLTKLNKQLRKDKKSLRSKRAKRNYKYRNGLLKNMKSIQRLLQ